MFKKITLITLGLIFAFAAMFFNLSTAKAVEKKPVYFFWGDGCPHCHDEQLFWNKINDNYPDIEWIAYETWKNKEGYDLMQKMTKELLGKAEGRVPLTISARKKFSAFAMRIRLAWKSWTPWTNTPGPSTNDWPRPRTSPLVKMFLNSQYLARWMPRNYLCQS